MNGFVCDALSDSFRVHSAYDGREGLEMARVLLPDLIVCDFMMPEMSGDELVHACARSRASTPRPSSS